MTVERVAGRKSRVESKSQSHVTHAFPDCMKDWIFSLTSHMRTLFKNSEFATVCTVLYYVYIYEALEH